MSNELAAAPSAGTFTCTNNTPAVRLMTIQDQPAKAIVIHKTSDPGKIATLVSIDLDTGDLTYGPDYTPDEAARIFWEALATVGVTPQSPSDPTPGPLPPSPPA